MEQKFQTTTKISSGHNLFPVKWLNQTLSECKATSRLVNIKVMVCIAKVPGQLYITQTNTPGWSLPQYYQHSLLISQITPHRFPIHSGHSLTHINSAYTPTTHTQSSQFRIPRNWEKSIHETRWTRLRVQLHIVQNQYLISALESRIRSLLYMSLGRKCYLNDLGRSYISKIFHT